MPKNSFFLLVKKILVFFIVSIFLVGSFFLASFITNSDLSIKVISNNSSIVQQAYNVYFLAIDYDSFLSQSETDKALLLKSGSGIFYQQQETNFLVLNAFLTRNDVDLVKKKYENYPFMVLEIIFPTLSYNGQNKDLIKNFFSEIKIVTKEMFKLGKDMQNSHYDDFLLASKINSWQEKLFVLMNDFDAVNELSSFDKYVQICVNNCYDIVSQLSISKNDISSISKTLVQIFLQQNKLFKLCSK